MLPFLAGAALSGVGQVMKNKEDEEAARKQALAQLSNRFGGSFGGPAVPPPEGPSALSTMGNALGGAAAQSLTSDEDDESPWYKQAAKGYLSRG